MTNRLMHLKLARCPLWTVVVFVCCGVTLAALAQKRQPKKSIRRAKLPTFEHKLTSQFFFDDVFSKLNGPRPAQRTVIAPRRAAKETTNPNARAKKHAWAKIISSETIEGEVKSIKIRLDKSVTTPTDFAGRGFRVARRDFSILAVLFAIISEYDGDVRWKNDAMAARDIFARVASNAKASGNSNVYKEAKSRLEDLADLLRGSGLSRPVETPENAWDTITGRAPLMQRLDRGSKELAVWTASSGEFSRNAEQVLHEAEMIASISEILIKENMEDGDDEDYVAFVRRMQQAATNISSAVKLNNVDQARRASGEITQTCDACHELYQ